MGLTNKLGLLAQSVQQDTSLNIGIGGAANASFKLQVTGATNLTGVLTLGSTISNGTFTYTLPSATGTLALTSALSGYLPLTGGTLTGALSGTSATFSTEVTSSGSQGRFGGWATGAGYQGNALEVGVSGGIATLIGYNRTSGAYIPVLIGGNTNQTTTIGGNTIVLQNNGTTALTIASTGAATFSSSVTANSTINGYLSTITSGQNPATSGTTPTNPMLNLTNNRGVGLYVGGQHASPFGIWMQVADTSNLGAYYPLLLQPNGGNVGISQNTPTALLHLGVANAAVDGTKGVKITNPAGTTVILECGVSSDSFVGTTSASDFSIRTGNAERIRISNGGLVTVTGTGSSVNTEGIFFKRTSSLAQGGYINGNGGALQLTATNEYSSAYGTMIFNRFDGSTTLESMRITSGGQVQIKQGADGYTEGLRWINTLSNRWTFVNGGDNNLYIAFNEADRGIFNSSTGVYTAQSDVNKKKDFEQSTIGLNAILGLNPTLYRMKTDETEGSKELGFIAQEVKEFIPQAYVENGIENKFIGLNYNAIVAALVKGMQEQQAQIEELRQIVATK